MNETTPKISVIVPVYKAENYLHRCVDSLLAQTFQDFEILLVDDGSPDCSGEICDEYARKDKRVRVFHKENGGVSSARNLGLDNARGEWICFVDSDDWVEEDMLATICSLIQSKGQIDILFFGFQYDYPQAQIGKKQEVKKEMKYAYCDTIETILRSCYWLEKMGAFGWTCNKMFRWEIIQSNKIRFDETVSLHEDHLFTLDYVRYVKNLVMMPYYPYHYRVLDDSLMNKKRNYAECKKIIALLLQKRMFLTDMFESPISISYRKYAYESFIQTSFYSLSLLYEEKSTYTERMNEMKAFQEKLKMYKDSDNIKIICLQILSNISAIVLEYFCYIWFKLRS